MLNAIEKDESKMCKQNKHDIFLVFPPLIKTEVCPPAGIPSLVSYLKSQGYNPFALDFDLLFKKSFLTYKLVLFAQSKILSLRKSSLNVEITSKSLNKKQNASSSLYTRRQFIKKVGLFILRHSFKLEKSIFNLKPLPLDQVFKMFNDKTYSYKIEKHLESILRRTMEGKKILGISVVYPNQILYSLIIAKMAKRINKDIFVVLGGSQITMHINNLIKQNSLLNCIDAFIVHEGEMGLCALIHALESNKELNRVPNLYYKYGDEYRSSEFVDFVMPVEKYITPDFSGFDLKGYSQAMLPLRTLRGCFWGKCRFCTYSYISGKFTLTSPEFVVNSIMVLKKRYNIKRFEFIDSSVPANFLKSIAESIIRNDLDIRWNCRANLQDTFKDIEFVKLLKKSGCESLALGLESGNNRIIRHMNKLQRDKDVVLEIIKALTSQNITSLLYVMLGFPTEAKSEAEETIDFVMRLLKEYKCALNGVGVFNLQENTYIFNNPGEFRIKKIYDGNYNACQGYGHKFEASEGMSRKEIYAMCRKARLFIKYPFLYNMQNRIRGVFK